MIIRGIPCGLKKTNYKHMKSKSKYIGLNQRIPFEVLDYAIKTQIETGTVDRNQVLERMKAFTSGENRAKKAASYVMQILKKQEKILTDLKKTYGLKLYTSLRTDERKALSLCLISMTYPITYDLLIALAQGFKVQDRINKKFISEKVMAIYGSNRTVDVAIDALLPMVIELQTLKREKVSIYSIGSKLKVIHPVLIELIVYTDIKLSGSKSILLDDLRFKPWYSYFEFEEEPKDFNFLLSKKDSAVGKGYLTI